MISRRAISKGLHTLGAVAALGVSAGGLFGCSPQGGLDPTAQVLDAIQHAPFTVAYSGTRRVEVHWTVLGSPESLVLLESVHSDGGGKFKIDPLSIEQSTSAVDPQVLLLIEKAREGFHYFYRDFLVRDLTLFLQNYQFLDLGKMVTVAGRQCAEFNIQRDELGGPSYTVATDVATGLVLRWSEYDAGGALVARSEFLSVDYQPDLTGAEFHVAGNSELVVDPSGDVAQALGFAPLVPKAFPVGFAFEKLTKLTDETGRDWACYVLGDGVEAVFFLHAAAVQGSGASTGGGGVGSPGGPTQTGTSQGSASGTSGIATVQNDLVPDSVGVLRVGPWSVVQGHWSQHPVIALGKVDTSELVALIESAAP